VESFKEVLETIKKTLQTGNLELGKLKPHQLLEMLEEIISGLEGNDRVKANAIINEYKQGSWSPQARRSLEQLISRISSWDDKVNHVYYRCFFKDALMQQLSGSHKREVSTLPEVCPQESQENQMQQPSGNPKGEVPKLPDGQMQQPSGNQNEEVSKLAEGQLQQPSGNQKEEVSKLAENVPGAKERDISHVLYNFAMSLAWRYVVATMDLSSPPLFKVAFNVTSFLLFQKDQTKFKGPDRRAIHTASPPLRLMKVPFCPQSPSEWLEGARKSGIIGKTEDTKLPSSPTALDHLNQDFFDLGMNKHVLLNPNPGHGYMFEACGRMYVTHTIEKKPKADFLIFGIGILHLVIQVAGDDFGDDSDEYQGMLKVTATPKDKLTADTVKALVSRPENIPSILSWAMVLHSFNSRPKDSVCCTGTCEAMAADQA